MKRAKSPFAAAPLRAPEVCRKCFQCISVTLRCFQAISFDVCCHCAPMQAPLCMGDAELCDKALKERRRRKKKKKLNISLQTEKHPWNICIFVGVLPGQIFLDSCGVLITRSSCLGSKPLAPPHHTNLLPVVLENLTKELLRARYLRVIALDAMAHVTKMMSSSHYPRFAIIQVPLWDFSSLQCILAVCPVRVKPLQMAQSPRV